MWCSSGSAKQQAFGSVSLQANLCFFSQILPVTGEGKIGMCPGRALTWCWRQLPGPGATAPSLRVGSGDAQRCSLLSDPGQGSSQADGMEMVTHRWVLANSTEEQAACTKLSPSENRACKDIIPPRMYWVLLLYLIHRPINVQ